MKKIGNITKEPGAETTDDEIRVAWFLIELGFNIKFLRANRAKGSKTPDIVIDNVKWEIKTPRKAKENTLDHAMKKGLKQSVNLIFDLRKMRNTGEKASRKLQREFKLHKKWKRLWIITTEDKLLTFEK